MKNPEKMIQAKRHVAMPRASFAVGIYGLTQSILQLLLTYLPDRIGRKPVFLGNFLIFAVGSVGVAMSHPLQHRECHL